MLLEPIQVTGDSGEARGVISTTTPRTERNDADLGVAGNKRTTRVPVANRFPSVSQGTQMGVDDDAVRLAAAKVADNRDVCFLKHGRGATDNRIEAPTTNYRVVTCKKQNQESYHESFYFGIVCILVLLCVLNF